MIIIDHVNTLILESSENVNSPKITCKEYVVFITNLLLAIRYNCIH